MGSMIRRVGLWLVALCGLASLATPVAAQAKPNVVFILVDDVGYNDLGCMGSKDIRTPHIDRLAKEGVKFTSFYSNAPVCTPTRAAFMTGRWQQRVGLEWAMGFTAEQYRRVTVKDGAKGDVKWVPEPNKLALGLPATQMTIARLLKALGYRTGCLGKWHLGYLPEYNPVRHGFDEYFGVLLGHADYYRYNYFDGTHCLFENDKPAKATGYLTDLLNQKAVDFIGRHAKEPFFLYIPHLACHFPFQSPDDPSQKLTKENHEQGSRKIYKSMLERVDQGVGQILGALDKHGLADNTLVIFSSDNGGYKYSDNSPLFHHKSTLWEGGVRVPCLMRWPAVLPRGQVTDQPGITMDLTATILAAAGGELGTLQLPAKLRQEHTLDGINLLPILTGKHKQVQRNFFWRIDRADRKQKAARHGKWKYVKDGWLELLFDLENDPGGVRNVAYQHPEIVARIRQLLADWEADVGREPPPFVVK